MCTRKREKGMLCDWREGVTEKDKQKETKIQCVRGSERHQERANREGVPGRKSERGGVRTRFRLIGGWGGGEVDDDRRGGGAQGSPVRAAGTPSPFGSCL